MSKVSRFASKSKYLLLRRSAKIFPRPVFVLGNQKSGTSAIAGLLSHATGLELTLDFPVREYIFKDFYSVLSNQLNFDKFVSRNRIEFSNPIIKEPNLTFVFEELKAVFPEAQFVFVVRSPFENIRSIFDRLNIACSPNGLIYNGSKLNFVWQNILSGKDVLAESLYNSIANDPVKVLSHRWNLCVQKYFKNQDNCLLVKYEDFILEKQKVIENLASSLGLEVNNDISDRIDFQFQPKGKSFVEPKSFFNKEQYFSIDEITKANRNNLGYV